MKNYDFFVIGHISLDENIYLQKKEKSVGGAILYSSSVYSSLGKKVAVLTKLSPSDNHSIHQLNVSEKDIYLIPSKKTTSIRNEYLDESREKRISTALATADPFLISDIPEKLTARVIHFASLIYGEYQSDLIKLLAKKAKIAVDIQGFLRNVGEEGKLVYKNWKDKELYLPHIDYLKTDAAEAEFLTGENDLSGAAEILHQWGAKEIMITHHSKVLVYNGSNFFHYPLKPRNLSGRTGRGDTCFSSYLSKRLNNNIDQSLLFAVALTSLKLANPGPFKGNKYDVEYFIRENY
jgi:sugar/nucleoside kinase (ribokinase family)